MSSQYKFHPASFCQKSRSWISPRSLSDPLPQAKKDCIWGGEGGCCTFMGRVLELGYYRISRAGPPPVLFLRPKGGAGETLKLRLATPADRQEWLRRLTDAVQGARPAQPLRGGQTPHWSVANIWSPWS